MEPFRVIKYPCSTEKAIRMMESENKLVFVVDKKSTKKDVVDSFEKAFGVKIIKVNLQNTSDGKKRAVLKFSAETPAIDLATKLGLI
ncbi:MAG: 50S ribosomal protein L23 [Candidatus Woesearchaeota archaeon]